jgi:hypothetical protein
MISKELESGWFSLQTLSIDVRNTGGHSCHAHR